MSDTRMDADAGEFDADDVPDTVVVVWVAAFLVIVGAAYLGVVLALRLAVWVFASP